MKILSKIWYFLVLILLIYLILEDNTPSTVNFNESFTIKKYLENPEKYGDRNIERMGFVVNISNDSFYFYSGRNTLIEIFGPPVEKAVLGETIVYAKLRKDGVIELIDYHNYNYNYFIYIVSFLALIVFIILLLKEWKITKRGFEDA